ncbi:hypothetical protein E7T09_12955 [Deinococcus sp. KSM4-11]|uniref:hypothetical protein n=1 Tax=Deinococcus sp. KSM4-11 TaxID=2568654 RepID=UPI0010A2DC3F|nr:hypothetical protein [Deinococcus sp. KSM4-11]THF86133.1 hypothetical protein E7T09_12955 [Deinococcus sp. KSM4-11]
MTVALLTLAAPTVLTGCGNLAIAAATIQFSLSAPASLVVKQGDTEATPLVISVMHIIASPLTVPISLELVSPPVGVHAEKSEVGIGRASGTLNVFIDNSYAGSKDFTLTVQGKALQVYTQKVNVMVKVSTQN